jgi:hypothetical protein
MSHPPCGDVTASALATAWSRLSPVVDACLDPSVTARDTVAASSLSASLADVYCVCAAPPDAVAQPQPQRLYALLRAQLHIHARAAAAVLARVLAPRAVELAPHHVHLVSDESVFARAEHLASGLAVRMSEKNRRNDDTDLDLLRVYATLWKTFEEGVGDIAGLFSYLDRIWVSTRHGYDIDALDGADRLALGQHNLAVHDVRTTAMLAWRHQLLEPLAPLVTRAALDAIASERTYRGVLASSGAPFVAGVLSSWTPASLLHLEPVLQSLSVVGGVACAFPSFTTSVASSAFASASPSRDSSSPFPSALLGMVSTATAGLSDAAAVPNPLRISTAEQEAGTLVMYRSLFETPFLDGLHRFYVAKSSAMISASDMSVREYIRTVESLRQVEMEHTSTFIDASSVEHVHRVLELALIADHAPSFHVEAESMLRDGSTSDLKLLYELLSHIPDSIRPMHAQLRACVESTGSAAVRPWSTFDVMSPSARSAAVVPHAGSDAIRTPAAAFTHAAWDVYARYSAITTKAFGSDRDFASALDQGCERFINSIRAAPDLLAEFCHELLEETEPVSAALPEHEVMAWMGRVARMFRFLNDKDVFQRMYAVKLTRRLIYGTSSSRAVEDAMLALLHETCGLEYTSRLQRMFADVASSSKESAQFVSAWSSGAFESADLDFLDVHVLVLSASAWPALSHSIPPSIAPLPASSSSPSVANGHLVSLASELSDSEGYGSGIETQEAENLLPRSDSAAQASLAVSAMATLPTHIARIPVCFAEYYSTSQQRHEDRRLQWMFHYCRLDITARFDQGDSTEIAIVEASLPQAAVLLQFNSRESLSVRQMRSLLGMPLAELISVLGVLVQAGLLYPSLPSGERHTDTNMAGEVKSVTFTGNTVLSVASTVPKYHRNSRGQIPLALMSYQGDEHLRVKRALVDIDGNRRQQIKAAIVGIMKHTQRLDESSLVEQVCAKLARLFAVRDGDVVDSISVLVETEYLEYEVEGTVVFYVA